MPYEHQRIIQQYPLCHKRAIAYVQSAIHCTDYQTQDERDICYAQFGYTKELYETILNNQCQEYWDMFWLIQQSCKDNQNTSSLNYDHDCIFKQLSILDR